MLNSRPFFKNIILIVLFGWTAAFVLDLILDQFRPLNSWFYGPDGKMWEGALCFSVICSLWLQAEESSLVEKKSLAEISFLRVVAGLIAGLFVGALLALPIWIITDHQQLLRMLDYVGFFEVGALGAVALWVLIYQKLFRRFYPAHYFRDDRLANLPNQEPNDPDDTDDTSPDPTNGDGGVIVEIPEAGQFSEAPLQENLQHLDTELEELSFHDLMRRINRHTPTIEGQPIFQLLDYLNRQGARIDKQRSRLLAAISNAENASNHQFVQRAQQILEKIKNGKQLILSPIEFPTTPTGLREDFALYTRKVELLISKLDQVVVQHSEFQDALRETTSIKENELRRQLGYLAANASSVAWNNFSDEERGARSHAYIDQEGNLKTAIENLRRLRDQGVSITANLQRQAIETRERIAVVLPPYFGLLSRLQTQIDASENSVETDRAVQEPDGSTSPLENAIIAYKNAIETADAVLIEQKLEQLAVELSEISTDPEMPESFSAAIEALGPKEPAVNFWRYPYILETPNELDEFLDEILSDGEFWVSLSDSAESHTEIREEIEVKLSMLEETYLQKSYLFGSLHL